MRKIVFFLFLTCAPYLAFASENNEFFNYKNIFAPKRNDTVEKEKIENNRKTTELKEKVCFYPKFPDQMNIPDGVIIEKQFFKGEKLILSLKFENGEKKLCALRHFEPIKRLDFLAPEGNLSIKFHTFNGRKLDKNEYLEISTRLPAYLCSIGGYVKIEFGQTIQIPKRDIQFVNFKLNTDKESAIGFVNKKGKNFFIGEDVENTSMGKREINHKAGLIELEKLAIQHKDHGVLKDIFLNVWFKNGEYKYGYSPFIPLEPEEPK